MKFHRGIVALAAMAVIGLGMRSGSAASVSISTGSFSSAASPVGSFTGTVDYNALALPQPRLTVTLTNTGTTAMNIVGFAFNFPNDIVDHLALVTPASGWQLTSDAAASPFSNFDALVSTDGSFNGGGPGTGGILPNGGTGTWNLSVFLKSPHVAADLSTVSFLSEADTKKDQVFVVRFQGGGGVE